MKMDTDYTILSENIPQWKIIVRQVFICSIPISLSFIYGLCIGSPTVIIPQIRKRMNSTSAVSDEMASWTSSIVNFAGIAWVILLTAFLHYIGRKKSSFIVNICAFFAFIYLYFSKTILQVFVSLAVLGVASASIKTMTVMIATEYTGKKIRGVILSCKIASFFWGIWVSNAVGTFFMWENIAIIGSICSFYNFIVTIYMPESPIWLANQGKFDCCVKWHRWLKGVEVDTERELDSLVKSEKGLSEEFKGKSTKHTVRLYFSLIFKPEVYKAIACSALVACLYDWSGKLTYTVYSIDMIKKITNSERTAYIGMLILDGFSVLSVYISCILVKYLKRKTLLISSTSVCIFFLYSISLHIILVKYSLLSENSYVSIALLVGYSTAVCLGPVPLSVVLCGELLPTKCRSICCLISAITTKMTVGAFLKISPLLFKTIGFFGVFLTFGTVSSLILFLIQKYVPETKDKTLEEISQMFATESDETKNDFLLKKNDSNNMTSNIY